MDKLVNHGWQGNIRELENVIERTILFCEEPQIRVANLPPELIAAPPAPAVPGDGKIQAPQASSSSGSLPLMPSSSATMPASSLPPVGEEVGSLKEAVRVETERVERELIQRALDETGGNVTQAARKLQISRKSLQTKMKELGLRDKEQAG